jgi:hypothetical protein
MYITYNLFSEIHTGLHDSLNPRPELLAGVNDYLPVLVAMTSEILALREARVI